MRIIFYRFLSIIFLITAFSSNAAFATVYGILDVELTPCLETEVKFDNEELQAYQNDALTLKVTVGDKLIVEDKIEQRNGLFFWKKTIPINEDFSFSILKEGQAFSLVHPVDTQQKLSALLSGNKSLFRLVRSTSSPATKTIPIDIPPEFQQKPLIIILVDDKKGVVWSKRFASAGAKVSAKNVATQGDYKTFMSLITNGCVGVSQ